MKTISRSRRAANAAAEAREIVRRRRTQILGALTDAAALELDKFYINPNNAEAHLLFKRGLDTIYGLIGDYDQSEVLLCDILLERDVRNLSQVLKVTALSELINLPLEKIYDTYAMRGLKLPECVAYLHPQYKPKG